MDRFIQHSFFSTENFYYNYPELSVFSINHYQIITIAWNLFLVIVPLLFFLFLKIYWRQNKLTKLHQKLIAIVLFIFWAIFFPNTAYIITDIRHLLNYCPIDSPYKVCLDNAWMIAFFFFYASLGWIFFYYLLRLMSELIKEIINKLWSKIFIALIIPLTSLGLLLGLLNRFNSWDVFLYPALLIKMIGYYFHDFSYFIDWLVFTIFLYWLYFFGSVIFRKININDKVENNG